MSESGDAFARLQLESIRDALDDLGRNLRHMLEAPSPDKLLRMRGEMLAAESRRMLEFARRSTELVMAQREAHQRLLDAACVVQESMRQLALQSTGMWEAHLRASRQAIEQALDPEALSARRGRDGS